MARNFYGKIILFGEYAVVHGGSALVVPFHMYSGSLKFFRDPPMDLLGFYDYLQGRDYLDLGRLQSDISRGLFFDSNIPMGKGLGSSGALVAAIFYEYGLNGDLLANLRDMENYFHKKSSGIDPLTSYLNSPLLYQKGKFKEIGLQLKKGSFFLLDSNGHRDTVFLMNLFDKNLADLSFKNRFLQYQQVNDQIVNAFINGDDYTSLFKKISEIQLAIFAEWIPADTRSVWESGLNSDDYYLKMCGAGGGLFLGLVNRVAPHLPLIWPT
jgi:mevalonate kinase